MHVVRDVQKKVCTFKGLTVGTTVVIPEKQVHETDCISSVSVEAAVILRGVCTYVCVNVRVFAFLIMMYFFSLCQLWNKNCCR